MPVCYNKAMLIHGSRFYGIPVISIQTGAPIGFVYKPIIDPDTLKIIAFRLTGRLARKPRNILDVKSVREYSKFGLVIDDVDELIGPDDVIKISKVISLNFGLLALKVETKKGTKLGHLSDYTVTDDDFTVQQIIVKRSLFRSFLNPELIISRKEIVEITDYKIIVKDEEKTLKSRSEKEDFVPNFVNPFRTDPNFVATDTKKDKD